MMYAGRIAAGKSTVWPVAIRGALYLGCTHTAQNESLFLRRSGKFPKQSLLSEETFFGRLRKGDLLYPHLTEHR